MKYISKENNSIIGPLIISLIGVSIFNLLPVVLVNTANFSYVIVFGFTALFLFQIIFYTSRNKLSIRSNVLYIALLFWTIVVFLRGFSTDYDFLRSIFLSPYVFLPYTLPFVVKYFSIMDFKKILSFIFYINILYLLFLLLFFTRPGNDITLSLGFVEEVNKYLAFPNFLMLFSFTKLSKKEKLLTIIVFFVGFLISVFTARRSLTWTFACAFVLFMYLLYANNKRSLLKQIQFLIILIFIGVTMYFVYNKYENSLFGNLMAKIDADTRGTVLRDFDRDMEVDDLIFGRGLNGSYLLRETGREISENYSSQRNIIEAGYLNLVLKGGYILLILLLIIYLISIYNGFFKSKNNYSKAFAAFIFLHILEAYPAGVLTFNIRFFLIWFCIAMCWDKQFLKNTDDKLDMLLLKNKF